LTIGSLSQFAFTYITTIVIIFMMRSINTNWSIKTKY